MRTQWMYAIVALAAVGFSSGSAPLSSGSGRVLTLVVRSASITWTGDAPAASRRAHIKEVDRAKRRIESAEALTYMSEILTQHDSTLARWPNRTVKPVRVWIEQNPDLPSFSSRLHEEVRGAFFEWRDAGIPVEFSFVSDSANAEVTVRWVDRFDEPISGNTRWVHDQDGWIVGGSITIGLHNSGGFRLSATAVRAIALHEIGHLIGLDHTEEPSNIMAPRVRVKTLSDADRATAALLYTLRPGTLR